MKDWIRKKGLFYLLIFMVPIVILSLITAANNLYPFGKKTWLLWDQDVQYADYFQYLKNVLTGEAHIGYSFSKSLGGSLVGVFAYYLVSPLNLLVVFFQDTQIPLFIYIITAIKVGLCGVTAAFFFLHHGKLEKSRVFLLSMGYALMQYIFSQMSNIMWLDGVLLLPVILWAVDQFLKKGRILATVFFTAFCIVLNWYTAYMNCLFIVLYYLAQYIGRYYKKGTLKKAVGKFFLFLWAEFLGVMCSGFLFLPAVISLSNGKSVFDSRIFNLSVNNSPWAFLEGFLVGSNPGVRQIPSFFCGMLAVIFALYFFVSGKISRRRKATMGIFLIGMILTCHFNLLENIFNGLRFVYSYPYRFSYLIIFTFLLTASEGVEVFEPRDKKKVLFLLIVFYVLIGALTIWMPLEHPKYLWISGGIALVTGVLIFWNRHYQRYALCILVCIELGLNGFLVLRMITEYSGSAQAYQEYVSEANKTQEALEKYDDTPFYRMEQTSARGSDANGDRIHGHYSENMAYGYYGISQYSSSYDYPVSEFISKLGYSDSIDLTIYDEPILASDAFLGIKYVLSDFAIPFYDEIDSIPEYNGKRVYENPYVLPLAMPASEKVLQIVEDTDNPFVYQNQFFSLILGEEIQLYKEIPCDEENTADGVRYILDTAKLEGENPIYGYARPEQQDLILKIDGEKRCVYNTWLSYLVFNIGSSSQEHSVEFCKDQGDFSVGAHFWYLDMDVWKNVVDRLNTGNTEVTQFEDGKVKFSCESDKDGYIITSIPYDENWEISVDGKEAEAQSANGSLLAVSTDGAARHEIVMEYHVPGVLPGIIITAVGAGAALLTNKRIRRKGAAL